jgi:crossover junction endodeoxyribonuclease RuvC
MPRTKQRAGSTFKLTGFDPGFANFGWGVVRIHPDGDELVDVGVFRTQKESKKKRVLAAEDNFERARSIAGFLHGLIEEHGPKVVCFEAFSPMRNASSASKVALSYGALAGVIIGPGLPSVQPSPQRIKKSMTGRQSASKDEIAAAVVKHFCDQQPEELRKLNAEAVAAYLAKVPASRREHGFDALASILASYESDIIRAARQFLS